MMKNTKQSITFKVMLGYVLIATLAALAVWFIYSQVLSYTSMAESNIVSNKKLYLVGEAATNLYEAESLSRRFIQTEDSTVFKAYKAEIDSIRSTLDLLRQTYTDTILKKEVDSINYLLTQKTANLEELLILRAQKGNQSYYTKVISELQKVDENFEDPNYEERFKGLKPYQRDILIRLLEYSDNQNNKEITEKTIDSLVSSVKNVLTELEVADKRYRETLRAKENELLANEIRLNGQLQNLLSTIEEEERRISLRQVTASQDMVKKTSQTIAILAAISLLVIFVFLFLVIKDVTQSQRYRTELENAKQYAERILKSKEQFMATVTHDLRSPLNTVVGYTNLLEKSELSRSQSHYLNHLKKSSDFILRLVNDLLDLSKLEAGRMLVEKLPFNPKNLIEDTVENTISITKPEGVAVAIDISEELDRHVISDPFRIKQILMNLVVNACKFTEEGKITITSFLEKKGEDIFMTVEVKDTGIGISEDKKEAVFEEFSQENSSIEKRFGGSGLGLAITKKLVDLLNGTISLESELGEGSKFTLCVPIVLAKESDTRTEIKRIIPENGLKGAAVLIVDDEPAQITLLSEL
ncbi:MAG TPA: ATP-binding protein, partial [Salinimicrobium sp.]|nr:ATP-binding protein [Salinimicrobium sp.]